MLCQALRNVPKSKLKVVLEKIDKIEDDHKRKIAQEAFIRYFEANIPVIYWYLDMEKDFEGDKILYETYHALCDDLAKTHAEGKSLCFAGGFGRGKTMTCTNILKKAVQKGYSGLYVTLNDIISATMSAETYLARKELLIVDFLVVDEFDSRHIGSTDKSAEFFGRTLEDVLRTRSQNALPLFLCTNSPNPVESFNGSIKESITSLWNHIETIPVLGKDFRVKGVK